MPAKGTGKVFKHAFSRTGVIVGAKNVIGLSLAVNYGDFAFLPGYLFGNPLFIHAVSFNPLFPRWSGIGGIHSASIRRLLGPERSCFGEGRGFP